MLKLKYQEFDQLGNLIKSVDCGRFRSYVDIGKHLRAKGRVGKYYVMPNNMTSLASMREIEVTKDKYGKQVIMEGAVY